VLTEIGKSQNECPQSASPGVFEDIGDAVEACFTAQKALANLSLHGRSVIIESIRKAATDHAEEVSKMAVDETRMGNWEHKLLKNRLVAAKTPGVEDLHSEAMSGDNGLTLMEFSPFGVIGAITPVTNPTETVICNTIGMIASGNGVVFSPHPAAKNVSLRMIEIINKAIIAVGGPQNIVTTVRDPTIEQANNLMKHPKVKLLVATGGPAVVKAVLSSGKKAIGAGAGNPPALVDETADIPQAARDVILGCSFDNNLPCIAEKEIIVVEQVADNLIRYMKDEGAYFITSPDMLTRLENLLLDGAGINKEYVGKSASSILKEIGVSCPNDVKVVAMTTNLDHPFVQHELMMPVLPIVKVRDVEEGIAAAVEVEHGFRHTAIMHSMDVRRLSKFAKTIQTTIFVKNGPSYAGIGFGGEGFTTFTIAGPTGEGLTSAKTFSRRRRCVLTNALNIK
jgi:propionaldehyde dehydrogenase